MIRPLLARKALPFFLLAALLATLLPGVSWVPLVQAAAGPAGSRNGELGHPLAVDSSLDWNTFLGGKNGAFGGQVAIDKDGNVYVVGYGSDSWGAPVRPFTDDASQTPDVSVAKLDSGGNLLWNTFLGGAGIDFGGYIAVDGSGNAYVAGTSQNAWSCSPVTCTVRSFSDADPIFVAKLDTHGELIWNSFLGGRPVDTDVAITVDDSAAVYVTSAAPRSWGSPLRPFSEGFDALVAKLDTDGRLIWHTFLGGYESDRGMDIAADHNGNIYVIGTSYDAWDCAPAAPSCVVRGYSSLDAFVAKLNSTGLLLWTTFLGGETSDRGLSIAVDDRNRVYVSGTSTGTWGSPVRPYSPGSNPDGGDDAFAARLDASGHLIWNTFLGDKYPDTGACITAGSRGEVYVIGRGEGSWGSPYLDFAGYSDPFVARLNERGHLVWNTFLGSSKQDAGVGGAVDTTGHVFVAGYSSGTWGTPLRPFAGRPSIFVAQLTPFYSTVWMPLAVTD